MKPVKLKNIYTRDVVYCEDVNDITVVGEKSFIRVYSEDNIKRTFLVNKASFDVLV